MKIAITIALCCLIYSAKAQTIHTGKFYMSEVRYDNGYMSVPPELWLKSPAANALVMNANGMNRFYFYRNRVYKLRKPERPIEGDIWHPSQLIFEVFLAGDWRKATEKLQFCSTRHFSKS